EPRQHLRFRHGREFAELRTGDRRRRDAHHPGDHPVPNVMTMKPILLLVAASLFAQEVTFKTETKLVVVNVTVKDKQGKPLTSLKKEDIEIFEDGVKQNLAVFELEQLSNDLLAPVANTAAPATLEERVPSAPAGQAVTTAAANTPVRHQDKRLVGLFFDFSN